MDGMMKGQDGKWFSYFFDATNGTVRMVGFFDHALSSVATIVYFTGKAA